jgi:hypothetical protein
VSLGGMLPPSPGTSSWFLVSPFSEFIALAPRYWPRMKDHGIYASIKRDPALGIESLAVDFELGRIRLPYGGVESRSQTLTLKQEAATYPLPAPTTCSWPCGSLRQAAGS